MHDSAAQPEPHSRGTDSSAWAGPLIPVTLILPGDIPVTVAAEPVTEHFVLTPALQIDESSVRYAGGRDLIHGRTATLITGDRRINLRDYAAALEQLPIDWETYDPAKLTQADEQLIADAYLQTLTNSPTETHWRDYGMEHARHPAGPLIHDHLAAADSLPGLREHLELLTATLHLHQDHPTTRACNEHLPELTAGINDYEYSLYTCIYLLTAISRLDRTAADTAARHLTTARQYPAQLADWISAWNDDRSRRRPLQTPGFPHLPQSTVPRARSTAEPARSAARSRPSVQRGRTKPGQGEHTPCEGQLPLPLPSPR